MKDTAPQNKTAISYRPDIDGLRALAVIAVFVFHAFPSVLKGGFVGVDFFFVISGFLISSIIFTQLGKGTFTFWNFYSRRIRRIYPVLITVLVCCFLTAFWLCVTNPMNSSIFFITPNDLELIGKHVAAGAGFVSNIVLWMESGYFDALSVLKPLLHLWSLGIEEQFYIVWPFLLWFCFKRRWNLFAVCAVIFVFSFGFNLYEYKVNPTADFYSPLTRFWELVAGAMLAWLTVNRGTFAAGSLGAKISSFLLPQEPGKKAQILSTAGVILVLVSVLLIKTTSSRGFPGAWALIPVAGAMLVIAAGEHGWFNRYVLSNKILVWLGLISYPLYLWHWPLLSFAHLAANKKDLPLWYSVIAFPLCVLLAWFTTKFIEHPLRFGEYGKQKTIGLFLAMIVVGAGAFFGAKAFTQMTRDTQIGRLASVMLEGTSHLQNIVRSAETESAKEQPALQTAAPKPTLVVLGDSHAAHLKTGLQTHLSDRWNVVMRPHPACPIIPKNSQRKECDAHFRQEMDYIAKTKPDKVVLAGNFALETYRFDWDILKTTVDTIRNSGVHDVVIVGAAPNYGTDLPRTIIREHRKLGNPDAPLPARVTVDLKKDTLCDAAFKERAKKWGVPYLSVLDTLCDGNTCRTFVTDDPASAVSYDSNHLSSYGSDYVMGILKNNPALQPGAAR